jgi:hypothetical protein
MTGVQEFIEAAFARGVWNEERMVMNVSRFSQANLRVARTPFAKTQQPLRNAVTSMSTTVRQLPTVPDGAPVSLAVRLAAIRVPAEVVR